MKIPHPTSPELTEMIEQWGEITKQHFEDYTGASEADPDHLDLVGFRHAMKMYGKAMMVLAALRHYKIELERSS